MRVGGRFDSFAVEVRVDLDRGESGVGQRVELGVHGREVDDEAEAVRCRWVHRVRPLVRGLRLVGAQVFPRVIGVALE